VPPGDINTPIDVDPQRVAEWLAQDANLQVIDVREPDEREAGYIAGSRHIPLVTLTSQAQTLTAIARSSSTAAWVGARTWPPRRFALPASKPTR